MACGQSIGLKDKRAFWSKVWKFSLLSDPWHSLTHTKVKRGQNDLLCRGQSCKLNKTEVSKWNYRRSLKKKENFKFEHKSDK